MSVTQMQRLCSGLLVACFLGTILAGTTAAEKPLAFQYADGKVSESDRSVRTHQAELKPVSDSVCAYASFAVGSQNPTPLAEDRPQGVQILTLGQTSQGKFVPALKIGLADSGRGSKKAPVLLVPWTNDGRLDYYGDFARPDTPCDFKLTLDLAKGQCTVCTSIRGDDEWFLLAENAPLINSVEVIDTVRVEQHPGSAGISNLVVQTKRWSEGEALRPHQRAKKDRVVGPDRGFKFQSMRSTWRKPGRHVTIARDPPVWMGFPDVVYAGGKTLVCTYCLGWGHGGGGALLVQRSEDLGQTWSEAIRVRPAGACPSRLQMLEDGSLLLLVDVGHKTVAFYSSRDKGKTWEPQGVLDPKKAGGHLVPSPSHVTELKDGSWLIIGSWYPGGDPSRGTLGEQLEFYRSTDRGKTWKFYSHLQPWHKTRHSIGEASILTLPDDRMVLFAREARQDGFPAVKAYSKDNGKTWEIKDLPFPIMGRTCAHFLKDGRAMLQFRSTVGRYALWAWVGDPLDDTPFRAIGVHFNDSRSVGLKDGALHIDNDGVRGQYTNYFFCPPTYIDCALDVTAEVKVVANQGLAATLSIPSTGKLRLFPDRVVLAHDPSVRVDVTPGEFHTYRVVSRDGKMKLYVDGQLKLETDKLDRRAKSIVWTPAKPSVYGLAFGNERRRNWANYDGGADVDPDMWAPNITPEVTGYSIWRRVEAVVEEPELGKRVTSWVARRDGFPDQYLLDHIIEVQGTVCRDSGYSGFAELPDGRIFVVNYTDDTAPLCKPGIGGGGARLGVSWIRGTYLLPEDLPPLENP